MTSSFHACMKRYILLFKSKRSARWDVCILCSNTNATQKNLDMCSDFWHLALAHVDTPLPQLLKPQAMISTSLNTAENTGCCTVCAYLKYTWPFFFFLHQKNLPFCLFSFGTAFIKNMSLASLTCSGLFLLTVSNLCLSHRIRTCYLKCSSHLGSQECLSIDINNTQYNTTQAHLLIGDMNETSEASFFFPLWLTCSMLCTHTLMVKRQS